VGIADRVSLEVPERPSGSLGLILVVDDEPGLRRFAGRVLEDEGYRVVEAVDGADALALVQAEDAAFDVVVSDILMPRLNGVDLLQRLSVSHPQLPVILMSGYGPPALAERGISAPCSVLSKPFSAERLVAEVHRCIEIGTS
jgi:two-component system, cell cycle sensor histidine kinase and response regulator CckA